MYDIFVGRSEADKEKYGTQGAVFLGRHYVKMGQTTSLSSKVYIDVAKSHVVFIVGKRGCLAGDTKIFTNHGYKEIKDFDPSRDKVYSYNGNSFEWENGELLNYHVDSEDLIKVDNYDGHSLIITEEHPLLVFENGKKIWKPSKDLKVGDILVANSNVPEVKNDKESFRIAKLLGFILADGTMQARSGRFKDGRGYWYNGTKRRVRLISGSSDIIATFKNELEQEFGIVAKRYKKGKENCEVVETRHSKVLEKLHSLGIPLGFKAGIIRVPKIVFESSNKFKANFIKALFACDGYVNKHGKHIIYYSKSRKFLEDLNLLLSHFNIQSTIRDKKVKLNGKIFHNYQLNITDHASLENFKKIGFVNKLKEERLNKHSFWQAKRRKKTQYLDENLFGNKITSISKVSGIKEVYDLIVPKNHSFIANGIISHNSGKSYTMGVIAEGIYDLPDEIKKNLAVVMLDTMGIYWTMKYPNNKEKELLDEWELESEGINVQIFTPVGFYDEYKEKGIPTDFPFSIKTSEINAEEWCMIFNVSITDPIGILIERIINNLKEEGIDYGIKDIAKAVEIDDRSEKSIKDAVENRFLVADKWGLFSKEGTLIEELVIPGQITILDVSAYTTTAGAENLRSLVIGLVAQKLFVQRMVSRRAEEEAAITEEIHFFEEERERKKEPIVWLIIDEAHEFLPNKGKTPATLPLITVLREGRQPGISLVLASQQPGKIHNDVITQSDIVIAHRITANVDVQALGGLMQSYMREGLDKQLNLLPTEEGAALVFDDTNEKLYPIRVRPRYSWHGGSAPTALPKEKKVFEF